VPETPPADREAGGTRALPIRPASDPPRSRRGAGSLRAQSRWHQRDRLRRSGIASVEPEVGKGSSGIWRDQRRGSPGHHGALRIVADWAAVLRFWPRQDLRVVARSPM